jgi:hypothetical protein
MCDDKSRDPYFLVTHTLEQEGLVASSACLLHAEQKVTEHSRQPSGNPLWFGQQSPIRATKRNDLS